MSAHHGKGRKRGGHEEEHENHERWAVSYADMMTVLMALFLVLYAMGSVDEAKYQALRTSLAAGFGNEALVSAGGSGILDGATGDPVPVGEEVPAEITPPAPPTAGPEAGAAAAPADPSAAAAAEADRLVDVRERIQAALDAAGRGDAAQMRITERGLEVVVVSDDVFFANARADLQPGGREVLAAIAPVLATLSEDVAVEGHTNHLPLTGGPFTSNRALSAMRATSVLTELTDVHGLAPDRLLAVGYAETQPLVPTSDPRAIEANRRVDIVVLSPAPPPVRALLPGLAEGAPAPAAEVATTVVATEQVAHTTTTEPSARAEGRQADHADQTDHGAPGGGAPHAGGPPEGAHG